MHIEFLPNPTAAQMLEKLKADGFTFDRMVDIKTLHPRGGVRAHLTPDSEYPEALGQLLDFVDYLQQDRFEMEKKLAATPALSLVQETPAAGKVFEAAWSMMVEQQHHHAQGWSMAKTWAFDNLRSALAPFRTEAGDELDHSKIAAALPQYQQERGAQELLVDLSQDIDQQLTWSTSVEDARSRVMDVLATYESLAATPTPPAKKEEPNG